MIFCFKSWTTRLYMYFRFSLVVPNLELLNLVNDKLYFPTNTEGTLQYPSVKLDHTGSIFMQYHGITKDVKSYTLLAPRQTRRR